MQLDVEVLTQFATQLLLAQLRASPPFVQASEGVLLVISQIEFAPARGHHSGKDNFELNFSFNI